MIAELATAFFAGVVFGILATHGVQGLATWRFERRQKVTRATHAHPRSVQPHDPEEARRAERAAAEAKKTYAKLRRKRKRRLLS